MTVVVTTGVTATGQREVNAKPTTPRDPVHGAIFATQTRATHNRRGELEQMNADEFNRRPVRRGQLHHLPGIGRRSSLKPHPRRPRCVPFESSIATIGTGVAGMQPTESVRVVGHQFSSGEPDDLCPESVLESDHACRATDLENPIHASTARRELDSFCHNQDMRA